jgi:hypothetical protein
MPAHNITVAATFFSVNTGIDDLEAQAFKAYVKEGLLHVSGLTSGKPWEVYNIAGAIVYRSVANGDEANVSLFVRGTYIVRSEGKTLKVVY